MVTEGSEERKGKGGEAERRNPLRDIIISTNISFESREGQRCFLKATNEHEVQVHKVEGDTKLQPVWRIKRWTSAAGGEI